MTRCVHVLLVEDSDKDAALILRELRKAGIEVVSDRVDSAEALERALRAGPWDIVLADHAMPSFDAQQALRIVRAHDADVSYVVVSGRIGEELAVETMRAGAQDYVMKDRLARLGPVVEREVSETEVRRGRARAVEALRDSEARKAAMLEAALDAVITIDHQGRIVDFNASAEEMFGYRFAEVVGQEMAPLIVPPPLRQAHRQGLARYLATGQGTLLGKRVELRAMRRDGSEFAAEFAVVRIAGRRPAMFTGFIRDVTERKQAEMRQRLLSEAGARLVESLDCATMLQGVAELVVRHCADWCGFELLDPRGALRRAAFAQRGLPDDRRAELTFVAQRAAAIAVRVVRERRPELSPRGSAMAFGSHLVVPLLCRDQALGAMILAHAPGPQAFGPPALELAEELAHRCATAVENAKLFEQVQDSVRVRDEFIAIAAHELRTPLTPLRLQAESLAADVASGIEPASARLATPVRNILRSSERLASLVERLLDFSRLTIGQMRLELEEVDLVAVVSDVIGELAGDLERAGSRVEWAPARSTPIVGQWDRRRLRVAIWNLVDNAVKFGPGQPVEVSVTEEAGRGRVAIRDYGPGLSEEQQAEIFERYRRPAPLSQYGGFGLGLWFVRQVAEQHGGHVEVSSAQGQGAEFVLVLPIRPFIPGAGCSVESKEHAAEPADDPQSRRAPYGGDANGA